LFSLQFAHALRESVLREPYPLARFNKDVLAGITVGIIAMPLAMALAIASGVAPQYGLYTAIIGGFLIALSGGSRYSVAGPTAAFVVILYPVAQTWGLSGLLVATVMSGVILVGMAFLRLGRLIQYIPESVVLGFTGGIAVVIVTLQLKDLFGLPVADMPEHFIDKLLVLAAHAGGVHWPSVAVAALTLVVMLLWPRLRTAVPAHLPAILSVSPFPMAAVAPASRRCCRIFSGRGCGRVHPARQLSGTGRPCANWCRQLWQWPCWGPSSPCCVPWYWMA
jgi:SulP family sulfate permease